MSRLGQLVGWEEVDQVEPMTERNRQEAALRSRSPLRSTADQRDAGHLPLFVAASEPTLL